MMTGDPPPPDKRNGLDSPALVSIYRGKIVSKGVGSILTVAALAVLVFASGCGGGDSSSSLTKAEYVKKVNDICLKESEKRFAKLLAKGDRLEEEARGKEVSAQAKEKAILSLMPSYEKMVDNLRALEAPEGDEEQLEAIWDAMDEGAQNVRESPGTAFVSDVNFRAANKLAKGYGLKECAFLS
jgi:hypothetical protein